MMVCGSERQFTRIYKADPRDRDYPLETRRFALRLERMWGAGFISDQGEEPKCVGHGWNGFLRASPKRWKGKSIPSWDEIYDLAQGVDGIPGPPPPYAGTTVRAGAKVLHKMGYLREYRWAKNIRDTKLYLLNDGPLVLGTEWTDGMCTPKQVKNRRTGQYETYIEPTGESIGGHCYLLIGYSYWRKAGRIINSWGEDWADRGRAWIAIDALDYLIFRLNGEACSAIEN